MEATAPLAGIVVVELGSSVAAPVGAQIFAELGAEVMKIENPGTGDDARTWGPPFIDGSSSTFHSINRNKMSAAIDLKDDIQRAALRRYILDRADVVIQNMRPGLVEQYGLDGKTLRAEKPSLIYCNLAAFGTVGPMAKTPGYDPLMQAFAGIMSITGHEDADPVRVAPAIVDQGTGMWAVIGILAALRRRDATGEGCEIGTSLYESAVNWIAPALATYQATKRLPKRMGTEHPSIAPYGAYRAADGWVVIAAANDNLFRKLAKALGGADWASDPDFASNPLRAAHRDKVNRLVSEAVAPLSRADIVAKLETEGVPCAPLLTLDQVLEHPQFKAVGILQQHPNSKIPLIGTPLTFDGKRPALRSAPPKLGEHTREVLGGVTSEAAK